MPLSFYLRNEQDPWNYSNYSYTELLWIFQKKINKAVRFVIICTILLNLIPTYVIYLLNTVILHRSVSIYIGEFISLTVITEGAICGVYYWRMFTTRGNSKAMVKSILKVTRQTGYNGAAALPRVSFQGGSTSTNNIRSGVNARPRPSLPAAIPLSTTASATPQHLQVHSANIVRIGGTNSVHALAVEKPLFAKLN